MKKVVCLAGLMLVMGVADVVAQSQFTHGPVTREVLADAIATNDKGVLKVDCQEIVRKFNLAYSARLHYEFKSCEELGGYYKRLEVKKLPEGTLTFSNVMPDGSINLRGFTRPTLPGEMGLCDPYARICVASLWCGNFTPDVLMHEEVAEVVVQTEEVKPEPPPTPQAKSLAEQALEAGAEAAAQDHPLEAVVQKSKSIWHWSRPGGQGLIVAGVTAVVVAIICAVKGCMVQKVNVGVAGK